MGGGPPGRVRGRPQYADWTGPGRRLAPAATERGRSPRPGFEAVTGDCGEFGERARASKIAVMTSVTHAFVRPGGRRTLRRARRRGQSLVEAALTMPLVIGLCLGIADGGRAFFYREAVTNATRQALRVASQTRAARATACQSVS